MQEIFVVKEIARLINTMEISDLQKMSKTETSKVMNDPFKTGAEIKLAKELKMPTAHDHGNCELCDQLEKELKFWKEHAESWEMFGMNTASELQSLQKKLK